MDFFVVPMVTFRVLYVWFGGERGRSGSRHHSLHDLR